MVIPMINVPPEIRLKQEAALHGEELLARLPGSVPLVGAEVGVWYGTTAEKLLKARPKLFLYMVDRWCTTELWPRGLEDETYLKHWRWMVEAEQRTQFAGFRRDIMHMDSAAAAAKIEGASLDFVFVDADHSYEAVRADIQIWWPKIKPGGLLSGHDYDHPYFPGVRQAVDEAVAEHGWALELSGHWTWFVRIPLIEGT